MLSLEFYYNLFWTCFRHPYTYGKCKQTYKWLFFLKLPTHGLTYLGSYSGWSLSTSLLQKQNYKFYPIFFHCLATYNSVEIELFFISYSSIPVSVPSVTESWFKDNCFHTLELSHNLSFGHKQWECNDKFWFSYESQVKYNLTFNLLARKTLLSRYF
jgi:hypothetical protein